MAEKKKLGEILLENGLIDEKQLEVALTRQSQWGGRLGKNLIDLGYTSEINLLKFLSKQLKFPCADLSKLEISRKTYSIISVDLAKKYTVFPIQLKESGGKKVLFLAMSDPTNLVATDEIDFITGFTSKPVIATNTQIEGAIEKYYVNMLFDIKPLTEKIPSINQNEIEILHEITLKEQTEIEHEEEAKIASTKKLKFKNPELSALIILLDEKNIITKGEYSKKLKQIMKEGA